MAHGNPLGPIGDLWSRINPFSSKVEQAGNLNCSTPPYQQSQVAGCQQCKKAVDDAKKNVPKAAKAASEMDRAATTTGAARLGEAPTGVTSNLTSFTREQAGADAARTSNRGRVQAANQASDEFEKCRKQVEEACMGKSGPVLAEPDKKIVGAVFRACQQGEGAADDFSKQRQADNLGLGDLAKAMGLAQQAMGMAQQAQGQQSPTDISGLGAPGATSPTPASGNSQKPEILTAKLDGDKAGTQAPTVGFGNSVVPNQVASAAGITGISDSSGASSSPDAFGGFRSSSTGGPASGGEVGANTGGAGGAGGSSGGNSTGASRPIDGMAGGPGSGAGDSGYEVSGGGGRPMSGLKPSKAELDSVADGSILGAGDAKLDDFGRDPASEGEITAAPDEDTQSGSDSIFMRIRAKYSLLKGSGKI